MSNPVLDRVYVWQLSLRYLEISGTSRGLITRVKPLPPVRRHNPEDHNAHFHQCEDLRSRAVCLVHAVQL
jgi:hypothetical protein